MGIYWLVVWNVHYFFHILGIVIPIDELIFFSGVETTNQYINGSEDARRNVNGGIKIHKNQLWSTVKTKRAPG